MNTLPRILLPLALALGSCEPKAPEQLSPEAAAEFIALRESAKAVSKALPGRSIFTKASELEKQLRQLFEERDELLRQYARSGDVTLRTPTTHQTMLHHAVQYRKEALVRELLQQGADPNATCDYSLLNLHHEEMDAPLAWTVVPETTKEETQRTPYRETAIRLINMLVAAGARTDGEAGGHALFMCSISSHEGAEDVYLHLLSLGANPRLGYLNDKGDEAYLQQALEVIQNRAWTRALSKLLDMGHIPADFRDNEQKTLLFAQVEKLLYLLRSGDCYAHADNAQEWNVALQKETQNHLALIRTLLEHGADPNAPQGGGWTPLNYAAAITPQEMLPGSIYADKDAALAAHRELLELLLRHGGDRQAIIPSYHGKPARRVEEALH